MNQLTVPKIKDMVYAPAQKYEDIYKTISQNVNVDTTQIQDLDQVLTKPTQSSMKNELKNFLKDKLKGTTNPLSFESETISFSSF
jgi:hypothetical protein